MPTTRRDFLKQSFGATLSTLVGEPRRSESEPLGELLGALTFAGEGDFPLDTVVGSGLDGRRALDLSRLGPESLITPRERFFIRTLCPDRLRAEGNWEIRLRGLVEAAVELELAELIREARPMGVHLVECAGNGGAAHFGLISAADWTGIPINALLERAKARREATRVLISGFDEHAGLGSDSQPGASWVFTFDDLLQAGAFLATQMNAAPLSRDHGFPVRLIVPGWFGCVSIKWVNEIVFVDDSAPATGQMREFASRTEQDPFGPTDFLLRPPGPSERSYGPRLAKDYRPATVELAALPVRVERWRMGERNVFRVVGILWGGEERVERLLIRFGPDEPYVPVEDCNHRTRSTWTLWSHRWQPSRPGRYRIELRVDEPSVQTRRMDRGYYIRTVELDEL